MTNSTRKRKPSKDTGGKLCAKCPPGDPCTDCRHEPPVDPRLIMGAYMATVTDVSRRLPIIDQDKLVEALGIDHEVWRIGYELKYEGQRWTFYLLLKNLQDAALNQRIVCGTY